MVFDPQQRRRSNRRKKSVKTRQILECQTCK
ncbi:predicted protein [Sclerotinia sclerotiorum 1980 UF-70]|uniref:Uncharacterized protein n=1 Tax=Sclerotinia sclerotiorum (strain ATCC 18683 / 1980 / Ss-1) TaxID=665079 RepID=A7F5P1_SCLS1|nr:predicted protein [Sclerotinia sclerotiorum 1980 UF-70]EDN98062.1 predicted protein [Sclerotinia sclerotiorum 1980 UF-70]